MTLTADGLHVMRRCCEESSSECDDDDYDELTLDDGRPTNIIDCSAHLEPTLDDESWD